MTGGPQAALWGFFVFYLSCIVITWWFYTRRGGLLRDVEGGGPSQTTRAPIHNQPNDWGRQMSHFLDRLTFFNRVEGDFADGLPLLVSEII
jgi:hypothetical protein